MRDTYFERAIFLDWFCAKPDCAFCYMSTLKGKADPKRARRRTSSILAEILLCKKLNWKIEFLSGGYHCHSKKEILGLLKKIYKITKKKQWLNIGTLNREELLLFLPYIEGVTGTVECINEEIRAKVCPSKPLKDITDMFKTCDELKIKKGITIIIGLGETEKDIPDLCKFIKRHSVDRITFYALNPHEGTVFHKGPETDYYVKWIRETRKAFPKLNIIAGSWIDRLEEIHLLLAVGADNITKLPAMKVFNTEEAKQIEKEVKLAKRNLKSIFTNLPEINWDKEINALPFDKELKEDIKTKLFQYLKRMS